MWCTRWFLPLVILPLPTAPPYFLVIFMISTFLHARPCFYCMMLLAVVFSSSCYWQTIPIDAPLTRPLGNATTFGEAILANISLPDSFTVSAQNYSLSSEPMSISSSANSDSNADLDSQALNGRRNVVELPPVVQLLDRCWCNIFSRSGLFEPSDVSRWEWESVQVAKKAIEEKARAAVAAAGIKSGEDGEEEIVADESVGKEKEKGDVVVGADSDVNGDSHSTTTRSSFSLRGLRSLLFPTASPSNAAKYRLKQHASSVASPTPSSLNSESDSTVQTSSESSDPLDASSNQAETESRHLRAETDPAQSPLSTPLTKRMRTKLLRPYYDLRPSGMDITLDFRWKRELQNTS